jgi:hypothetical protein
MKVTVLADESGELIGAMFPFDGEPRSVEDPQGARIVAREGQVAVTVDVPEELAHRAPGPEQFGALRQYVIRNGTLVKRGD